MEEENKAIKRINELKQDKEKRKNDKAIKREEKKRIKEMKNDEKEKALLSYRREQTRLREERKKRRDNLKNERALKREERRRIKLENKQKNRVRRKGLGGWITAVSILSVCTIILGTALTLFIVLPNSQDAEMNSLYSRSFYNTTNMVDNIDANLSKAIVTTDKSALQKYLVDTAINSELCESSISELPLQDESKFYTTKLINQIGDYSKYLNNKIIDGEDLTTDELNVLIRLYNANLSLKQALQNISAGLSEDSFIDVINDENGIVLSNFNELQNLSAEYPELIYDGPFSDGRDEREIKNLQGENIDYNKAKENFVNIFGEYGLIEITDAGESSGNIPCINVQASVKDDVLYAQFSVKGGKLIMFSYSGSCADINFNREEATNKALDFLESLGISNMEDVWVNLANNVYTINFAYKDNGVVVYSDLIKVRICAETGMVIGLEATSYYTNHCERTIGSATISEQTARQNVSSNIEIESSRICIVPIGESSEKLCYEFSGRYNGTLYYVYIDANNGKQVEMFKVIDSNEGEMLI